MATIAALAEAVKALLVANISAIDQSSIEDYDPPIVTQDTALIIPAFGQRSRYISIGVSGGPDHQVHQLRLEFWVKFLGDRGALTVRARSIPDQAMNTLLSNPDLGLTDGSSIGELTSDGRINYAMEAVADEGLIHVGNFDFLRITLPIWVYSGV
jgi:hypothetical protein